MVRGPNFHNEASLYKLNTSFADIYRLMNGSEKSVPETSFFVYVEVRDVAEVDLLAYEKAEAGGERFLVTGGGYSYKEVKDRTPEGKPGSGIGADFYGVDGNKAERVLVLKYTSLENCITDEVRGFLELEKKTGKV